MNYSSQQLGFNIVRIFFWYYFIALQLQFDNLAIIFVYLVIIRLNLTMLRIKNVIKQFNLEQCSLTNFRCVSK
jgi:hypothetical protein